MIESEQPTNYPVHLIHINAKLTPIKLIFEILNGLVVYGSDKFESGDLNEK